jgi:hypothetical protein
MKRAFFLGAIGFLALIINSCAEQKYAQPVPPPTTAEQANAQTGGAIASGPSGPIQYGVSGAPSVETQSGTGLESSTGYTPFGGRVGGFSTGGEATGGQQPGMPTQPAQPTGSQPR